MEEEKKSSKKIIITAVIIFLLIVTAAGSLWIRERYFQREKENITVPETVIPEEEVPAMEDVPVKEEETDAVPDIQEETGDQEEKSATEPEASAPALTESSNDPVEVRDITIWPGTEAVFKCYEKDAAEYRWEFYSVLDRQWESAERKPEFKVDTESDDLNRQVSCLHIPGIEENDSLSVRCTAVFPEEENIVSEGCLHIFTGNVKKISVQPMEAEVGEYLSNLELNAVITDEEGEEEEISGFQAMAFCIDQDEKESTVYDEESSMTTETYTKTFRESPYYLVEEGEQTVPVKLHMNGETYHTEIRILGKDTQPPILEDVRADYKVSGKEVGSTRVKIHAAATDNYSSPTELKYAFSRDDEAEEKDLEWTDKLPIETDITKNGTYYLFVKDMAGNTGRKELEIITVDMKAPVIEDIILGKGSDGGSRIEVTASDKTAIEYCFHLQGENAENWQKEPVYPADSNGEYVVEVRDAAGNISEGKITVSSIDTTAPVIKEISVITENPEVSADEEAEQRDIDITIRDPDVYGKTDRVLPETTDAPAFWSDNSGTAATISGNVVSRTDYVNRNIQDQTVQGIRGAKEDNGYLHVKYSGDGVHMTDTLEADSRYIGICVSADAEAPAYSVSYNWRRISYGKEMAQMQQTVEQMQAEIEKMQNEIEDLKKQAGE